jgi:hypothetical protein
MGDEQIDLAEPIGLGSEGPDPASRVEDDETARGASHLDR